MKARITRLDLKGNRIAFFEVNCNWISFDELSNPKSCGILIIPSSKTAENLLKKYCTANVLKYHMEFRNNLHIHVIYPHYLSEEYLTFETIKGKQIVSIHDEVKINKSHRI